MTAAAAVFDPLFEVAASLERIATQYAPDVRWSAPRRALAIEGRAELLRHLAAEAAAMSGAEWQTLRRAAIGHRAVEESVVRFVYAGEGIAGLALPSGTRVELLRVRLMEQSRGLIQAETCIETWSALGPWLSAPMAMAPRE